MSLLYRVIPRKNPQKPEEPAKYHAQASSRGKITVEQLLDAVCEETTLNRDEARMAVNRIFKKAGDFIDLGFNVHFGDLGYIHVSLKSKGVDTPEEVTAAQVTDIVPRFVFGKKLRDSIKNAKLEREGQHS
jgi:predicted histone-like DNA-binding protein